jgi:hypothetical protein
VRCALYICVIAAAVLIGGCSNEQVYNSIHGAKETECQKILDAGERNRCLNDAHKPYSTYKQQRDESIKNSFGIIL